MIRSGPDQLRSANSHSERRFNHYDILFYCAAIVALWYLLRPYTGITHDATIYVGRALADLHPSSIGQQLSYVHDGQSRFSVTRRLFQYLIGNFGPNVAAIGLTAIGLALWIGAATFLLSRLLPVRLLFAALLCLCAMPSAYGGNWVFHWAEPFATPRIFAEATSLVAMGGVVERRYVFAIICLIIAFLLHPIMALPAVGAAFFILCTSDLRWLWLGAAAFALLLIAGAVGAPLVNRLFLFPDPIWLNIIKDESRQVLLSAWYAPNWSLTGCQFFTVALCYYYGQAAVKRIAIAICLIAVASLVAAIGWPTVLILQAQPWRALWLLSFFASAMLPFVARELWTKGRTAQAALALLLAAWALYDHPAWSGPALVGAAGLILASGKWSLPRWILWICWGLTFAAIELFLVDTVPTAISMYRVLPDGIYNYLPDSVGLGVQFPVLVGLAILIALGWQPGTAVRPAIWAVAVILVAAAVTHWDRRSKFSEALDQGLGASDLRAQIIGGDVYWLGNYIGDMAKAASQDAWLWTGRPNWWDLEQGAGVVFDRTLAVESDRRVQLLRKVGLLEKGETGIGPLSIRPPLVTPNVLSTLCAAGGPDWIVAPLAETTATARAHTTSTWNAPAPTYMWDLSRKRMDLFKAYAIFNCHSVRAEKGAARVP